MAEKEKADKTKITKSIPKDAQVIMSILKELGVNDYEERVINQLLDITYRYVTCILDDAKVLANHARKKTIDLDDVKMALEDFLDRSFTQPPPREVLTKLAEERNSMPLPPIKPNSGLRLPPDRYCLTGVNYKMRSANPVKKVVKTLLEGRSTVKSQVKSGPHASQAKRQTVLAPKTQIVNIPKPILKFTTAPKTVSIEPKQDVEAMQVDNDVKLEADIDKRQDDEMDFEEVT